MTDYDTAGRVLVALLNITSLAHGGVSNLHLWPRLAGGFAIEWTGGPHAVEVAAELEQLAEDDEMTEVLRPSDVAVAGSVPGGHFVVMVRGVVFQLRPVDTIGKDEIRAKAVARG